MLMANGQNLVVIDVLETKPVSLPLVEEKGKSRGGNMKVSSVMLLKTNGGKMSEIDLSIMFMKRKGVTLVFPLY
jgi:hypothetical protein